MEICVLITLPIVIAFFQFCHRSNIIKIEKCYDRLRYDLFLSEEFFNKYELFYIYIKYVRNTISFLYIKNQI